MNYGVILINPNLILSTTYLVTYHLTILTNVPWKGIFIRKLMRHLPQDDVVWVHCYVYVQGPAVALVLTRVRPLSTGTHTLRDGKMFYRLFKLHHREL